MTTRDEAHEIVKHAFEFPHKDVDSGQIRQLAMYIYYLEIKLDLAAQGRDGEVQSWRKRLESIECNAQELYDRMWMDRAEADAKNKYGDVGVLSQRMRDLECWCNEIGINIRVNGE